MDPKKPTLDDMVRAGRMRAPIRPVDGFTRGQYAQDTSSRRPFVAESLIQDVVPEQQPTAQSETIPVRTEQIIPAPIFQSPVVVAQDNDAEQPQDAPNEAPQQFVAAPHIADNAVADQPKQRWLNRKTIPLYAMAVILFVFGIAVSLNGLHDNSQVAAQIGHTSTTKDGTSATGSAPSTDKPTTAIVRSYAVAPNLPRYIDIAQLDVHARILSMSIDSSNRLQSPGNVFDAGWYNASAQPGQPGAMLIDGHISSWKTKGVFYGLNKLVKGDKITIARGDGKEFMYSVVETHVFDANSVDMASLLVSKNTAKPGLNLISCSGDVIPGTNEFDKRVVVYAVMQ